VPPPKHRSVLLALSMLLAAAGPSMPPVVPGAYRDESGRTLYAALDIDSDGPQVNWLDPQTQTAGVTASIPAEWQLTQQIFERRTIVQAPQGPLGVSLYHVDDRKRATVILIHGNDAQTREMGFLAPLYVLNGVNVVTYDQRGTGESAGSWRDNGPAQRATDVEAIYDAIASDPRVDSKRIGLWAFSNGGWTAPIVATQRPIAFMLLVGAPASTLQANIEYEVAQRLQRAGYDAQIAQAVKTVSAMLAALDGTGSWESAKALYDASAGQKWLAALVLPPNMTFPPPGDARTNAARRRFRPAAFPRTGHRADARPIRRARSCGRRRARCAAARSRFQTSRHERSHRQGLPGGRALALSFTHRLSR
jgi:pimeloyl-ACP methyl ester carboxylesterase